MCDDRVALSCAVSDALASDLAVVTLESTVIAQGLPWPENLETAQAAQAAVRSVGVTPATIAVLDGVIRIGLGEIDLIRVASSGAKMPEVMDGGQPAPYERRNYDSLEKANRRDLGVIVARGGSAATTVSAALWIAGRYQLGSNARLAAEVVAVLSDGMPKNR